METLAPWEKYGLLGILMGVLVIQSGILLRSILNRSDKATEESVKSAGKAIELLQLQIAARDADLSWARSKIDTTQRDFLDALKSEREARERHADALLTLLRTDHKEAMQKLDLIHEGIEKLGDD